MLDEVGREGYKQRRNSLKSDFADRLTREEANEKKLRAEAIVELERFLGRHRSIRVTHPRRCSVWRSCSLSAQMKRSSVSQVADRRAGRAARVRSIRWNCIVGCCATSPSYRNNHLATYLLGYCLGEMDHDDEARRVSRSGLREQISAVCDACAAGGTQKQASVRWLRGASVGSEAARRDVDAPG